MASNVHYEWVVELTTTEATDEHEADEVLDVHGCQGYLDASRLAATLTEPGLAGVIVLVRDDLAGRSWAYLEDGALPSHFSDAYGNEVSKVPARFVAEVARAAASPAVQ